MSTPPSGTPIKPGPRPSEPIPCETPKDLPQPVDLESAIEVIAELRESMHNLEDSRELWMGIANDAIAKLERVKAVVASMA